MTVPRAGWTRGDPDGWRRMIDKLDAGDGSMGEGALDEVDAPRRADAGEWPGAARVAADMVRAAGVPAMLLHGPELKVLVFNEAFAEFLGGRPDPLGRPMLEVWPEIADTIAPQLRRAWNGETVRFEEVRFELLRDGRVHEGWYDYSYSPVRDEHGQVIGVLNLAVEQTGRLEAEAALRRSEAEARADAERVQLALAAGAIIGTWSWDLPTGRIAVDRQFAEAFGIDPRYGREGLEMMQVLETAHPDDRAGVVAAIEEAIRRGGPYARRYRVRRRDGRYYWIEANGEIRHAEDGTPLSFRGVLLDMEERRRIEAARQEDEARLSAVLEALPVGVVIVDGQGRLLHQNAAHRQLWNERIAADGWRDFARWPARRPDTGEPIGIRETALTRALLDGETTVGELVSITPGGAARPRHIINNAAPIRDPEGAVIGAVLAKQDVTTLHEVQAALTAAVGEKDALLYEVNHRVKNNLQVITSLLGMQAKQSASPEVRRHLLDARARIDVIASIHHSLYTTGAHSSVEIVSFLNDLARGTLESLGDGRIALRPAEGAEVRLPLATAMPLALIVSELLTNAVKYAFPPPMRGGIALSVEDAEHTLAVTVADDGIGLPERFDFSQPVGVGTRIVAALSKQLRAQITAPPTDRGTTFRIAVPKG